MNDAKKEKVKKNLVELNLMEQEDTIIEALQINYREKLVGKMGTWKACWVYFTEKRLVCVSGLFAKVAIPYKSIRQMEKCMQGLLPMGIAITYEDSTTGKMEEEKFSMMKRDKWMDFLSEKSGVAHS